MMRIYKKKLVLLPNVWIELLGFVLRRGWSSQHLCRSRFGSTSRLFLPLPLIFKFGFIFTQIS